MQIHWSAIVSGVTLLSALIKKWWGDYKSIITPIIEQVEQLAKDGKIDKDDRKKIAMNAISLLQSEGKIKKFNFIENIIVSKIVDELASHLPNFNISQNTQVYIDRARLLTQAQKLGE